MISHGKKKTEEEPSEEDVEKLKSLLANRREMDSLKLIVQILPDDYYAWHVLAKSGAEDLLKINMHALAANPKSYPAWHHRLLLVSGQKEQKNTMQEEERLTKLLLKHDPRNFHAWSYRKRLGMSIIRDLFNYSCLSDLVARKQAISAESLVSTDPYYEGGYNVLRFRREGILHLKIFADHVLLRFPRPFRGKVEFEDQVIELARPVLVHRFPETKSENPKIKIYGKEFQAKRQCNDDAFIDELLEIDPECALLNLAKLRSAENKEKWVRKLCVLDRIRERWYRKQRKAPFHVLELVETSFQEAQTS